MGVISVTVIASTFRGVGDHRRDRYRANEVAVADPTTARTLRWGPMTGHEGHNVHARAAEAALLSATPVAWRRKAATDRLQRALNLRELVTRAAGGHGTAAQTPGYPDARRRRTIRAWLLPGAGIRPQGCGAFWCTTTWS